MDTTPEHPAEQRSNVSPQESTSTASTTSNISTSISQIAGSSVGEVKNKVNSMYTYTSEPVQNVWEQVRSAATGAKAADNTDQDRDDWPDPEEIKQIDNMEKEKIVEFLQDRNRSLRRRGATSR